MNGRLFLLEEPPFGAVFVHDIDVFIPTNTKKTHTISRSKVGQRIIRAVRQHDVTHHFKVVREWSEAQRASKFNREMIREEHQALT